MRIEDVSGEGDRHYDVMVNGVAIRTTVTRCAETVDEWIAKSSQRRRRIVGMAAESTADPASEAQIDTLILCESNRCLVFEMSLYLLEESSMPHSLVRFLNDAENVFIGMGSTVSCVKLYCPVESGGAVYEDFGFLAAVNYNRPELSELDFSELGVVLTRAKVEEPLVLNLAAEWACVEAFLCWKFGTLSFKPIPPSPEWSPQVHYTFNVFRRPIHTTVPRTPFDVEAWISETAETKQRYVGFDIEVFYVNKRRRIGTVQFCIKEDSCVIIQLHQMNLCNSTKYLFLPNLVEFLLSDNNIFVGVDVERKMDMLLDMVAFVDRGIPTTVDLGEKAASIYNQPKLKYAGKNKLGSIFSLGNRLPEVGLDWDRPILSRDQLKYACIDAVVPFEISKGMPLL